jgi:NAD(P)-dependent dehydrogenase (short-subunit alcohol dehydrogenase family)
MAPFFLRFFYSQWFVTPPIPEESWEGKTCVVTGANVGLGLEAARHIARLGASKVILTSRNSEKAEAAKKSIEETTKCGPDVVETWQLDLCSYESVKQFAARCNTLSRIDAVIENAGVSTENFKMAERDESTITINVVSTFLLGLLLLPKLKETAQRYNTQPHLSIVSSGVQFLTSFPERKTPHDQSIFAALSDENKARMGDRYNVSKLLEVFIIREIVATKAPTGYPVIINFLHPGLCVSQLLREKPSLLVFTIRFILSARTTEVGSRTLVHAASAGEETHGQFLMDCKISDPAPLALSQEGKEVQSRIWKELSEKLEEIQPGILGNI